ncbi:MAG: UDP-3-O-(3-hydroxymyristoyl)glucosamine N-acyltransferase [Candidatus Omnitrophota bacterium]|jgi:UDP-3-O-[3-hydroxymyristoyl] glucosamine N-acyltransferase|nr:MAG: UDP-3-O-(3-hydroxymyristoyl)glucosamine N-acyltransferase [Candidatus Omnitrophota bacterium]
MRKTLKEIADFVGGKVVGDETIAVTGVAGIQDAQAGEITFLANPKYLPFLERTRACAVITSTDTKSAKKPLILAENPSLAFVKAVSFIVPEEAVHPRGLHPTAVIGKDACIGKNVSVGPYAVIEDGVSIGENSVIYAHCYIGKDCRIGNAVLMYPNVSMRERVTVGNKVIIHGGAVIGSDGFGFVTVEGIHHKIPQVGTVIIEDDVEIGANVTIDRARFDKTVIGKGTKIDNLVHIAHNVIIGQNCFVVAQVGISGSTSVGNNSILAGQVGVVGHISIGDNCVVMAQAGVSKSIPDNTVSWGSPAKPEKIAKRLNAALANLPRLFGSVAELKRRMEEIEKKIKEEK